MKSHTERAPATYSVVKGTAAIQMDTKMGQKWNLQAKMQSQKPVATDFWSFRGQKHVAQLSCSKIELRNIFSVSVGGTGIHHDQLHHNSLDKKAPPKKELILCGRCNTITSE